MKIPFPLFDAMAPALFDVFMGGRPVDRVVENNFKNHRQWGSRDRRLFAEVVFDVTRFVRLFAKQAGFSFDPHLGTANLKIEDFKSILAVYFAEKWPEIKTPFSLSETRISNPMTEAERLSYSDWLYQLGQKEMGQNWPALAESLNRIPDVYLRTNSLVTNRKSLQKKLADLNVQAEVLNSSEVALRLLERKNLFQSEIFKQGWFEVQDISSQRVAELLDPQPGERVVDACAGAGGKSLHLACLMQNQGRVLSM
ncbi:MAG: RNA methyltransferase, partial [Bdellovibrionales bacterium]